MTINNERLSVARRRRQRDHVSRPAFSAAVVLSCGGGPPGEFVGVPGRLYSTVSTQQEHVPSYSEPRSGGSPGECHSNACLHPEKGPTRSDSAN